MFSVGFLVVVALWWLLEDALTRFVPPPTKGLFEELLAPEGDASEEPAGHSRRQSFFDRRP